MQLTGDMKPGNVSVAAQQGMYFNQQQQQQQQPGGGGNILGGGPNETYCSVSQSQTINFTQQSLRQRQAAAAAAAQASGQQQGPGAGGGPVISGGGGPQQRVNPALGAPQVITNPMEHAQQQKIMQQQMMRAQVRFFYVILVKIGQSLEENEIEILHLILRAVVKFS